MGNWEIGKLGNWEIGKLGNWEIGKLGNWEIGKLGNCRGAQSETAEKGKAGIAFFQLGKTQPVRAAVVVSLRSLTLAATENAIFRGSVVPLAAALNPGLRRGRR
ncbi:MAG: hypothetical protein B9S34_16155 [Opitutia bacterium Tous-C1TDCM]|nr:MAG: hypothetical protein B9S34_16155 [Opitutae bacterium Tous-C1TDCM]